MLRAVPGAPAFEEACSLISSADRLDRPADKHAKPIDEANHDHEVVGSQKQEAQCEQERFHLRSGGHGGGIASGDQR